VADCARFVNTQYYLKLRFDFINNLLKSVFSLCSSANGHLSLNSRTNPLYQYYHGVSFSPCIKSLTPVVVGASLDAEWTDAYVFRETWRKVWGTKLPGISYLASVFYCKPSPFGLCCILYVRTLFLWWFLVRFHEVLVLPFIAILQLQSGSMRGASSD